MVKSTGLKTGHYKKQRFKESALKTRIRLRHYEKARGLRVLLMHHLCGIELYRCAGNVVLGIGDLFEKDH